MEWFFGLICLLIICGVFIGTSRRDRINAYLDKLHGDDVENTNSTPLKTTDTELICDLPAIYYGLAILCGITLLIFTAANSDELSSTQIGARVGYTVGGVLSMFAVGRVIELLQDIRDAVRNTPALSSDRPDDE